MWMKIGKSTQVPLRRVVCILNGRTISGMRRALLERAREDRRYRACEGKVRAYVLVQEADGQSVFYESPVNAATLVQRWQDARSYADVREEAVLTVTDAE